MEEEPKTNNNYISIILGIIVVALVVYILWNNNVLTNFKEVTKNIIESKEENVFVSNKALKILDYATYYDYYDDKVLALKVENISSKDFTNVEPIVIYYDENDMPIHQGWGHTIEYFEKGTTRLIEIDGIIEKYSKIGIGLFSDEYNYGYDEERNIENLKDYISYDIKENKPDEDGDVYLDLELNNKSNKDAQITFQVAYYYDNKLIYFDDNNYIVDANSSIETSYYLEREFFDETPFPDGYTYEITMVEAIEYVDYYSNNFEREVEGFLYVAYNDIYGEDILDSKIFVYSVLTAEDMKLEVESEEYEKLELEDDDLVFEADCKFMPATKDIAKKITKDISGEYDEDSGWVTGNNIKGILRIYYDEEYNPTYKITYLKNDV